MRLGVTLCTSCFTVLFCKANYTYRTWCYTLYILFYSGFVRAYLGNKMHDVVEGYVQLMYVSACAEKHSRTTPDRLRSQ